MPTFQSISPLVDSRDSGCIHEGVAVVRQTIGNTDIGSAREMRSAAVEAGERGILVYIVDGLAKELIYGD